MQATRRRSRAAHVEPCRRGVIIIWGVTAGKASHNGSYARGIPAGKIGRNSSYHNALPAMQRITTDISIPGEHFCHVQ